MKQYTQNYIRGGGTREFSEYYVAAYDSVRFSRSLIENVVFAQHNLAMDRSFNEFNVIVCRNVMIYFDKPLQEHVHELFYESLETFGILALGHKESIGFTRVRGPLRGDRRWTSGSTGRSREVYELIVIGTSWGGLDALSRLLDGLHDDVHQPIVVAQHRSVESEDGALARLLGHHTRRVVCDPDDKTPLEPDHVYLGAARLPPARRGRAPRAVDGRARAVRAAVDRRAVRVGRRRLRASGRSGSS